MAGVKAIKIFQRILESVREGKGRKGRYQRKVRKRQGRKGEDREEIEERKKGWKENLFAVACE